MAQDLDNRQAQNTQPGNKVKRQTIFVAMEKQINFLVLAPKNLIVLVARKISKSFTIKYRRKCYKINKKNYEKKYYEKRKKEVEK